jgi:hypothetical protein
MPQSEILIRFVESAPTHLGLNSFQPARRTSVEQAGFVQKAEQIYPLKPR